MKRLIEDDGKGVLVEMIGHRLTFFCMNYIYTGMLTSVNETCLLLTDPSIVYETGAFTEKAWADAQKLPDDLYVMLSAVESFGKVK